MLLQCDKVFWGTASPAHQKTYWTYSQADHIHSDWQSHLIYISAQHRRPPRAVCSAPSCSHCAPLTALPPPSAALQKKMTVYVGRKSTVLQSGARRPIYCSTSAEPGSWLSFVLLYCILERWRQSHTPLSTSVELRWNRCTVNSSLELQSLRTWSTRKHPDWKYHRLVL